MKENTTVAVALIIVFSLIGALIFLAVYSEPKQHKEIVVIPEPVTQPVTQPDTQPATQPEVENNDGEM